MSSGLSNRDCLPILGSSAEVFENPQSQLQAVIFVSANKIQVTLSTSDKLHYSCYYYHYLTTIFLPADVTGAHEYVVSFSVGINWRVYLGKYLVLIFLFFEMHVILLSS